MSTHISAHPAALLGMGVIEEGSMPPRGAAAEQHHWRLIGVWQELTRLLRLVREHGFAHRDAVAALRAVFDTTTRALEESPLAIRWDVAPRAFLFEGRAIWEPDASPLERIPSRLFAEGVRKMQLKAGVTSVELRDLATILLREGTCGEADVVAALWERRFERVAFLVLDPPPEGNAAPRDPAGGALEVRAIQRNVEEALKEIGAGGVAHSGSRRVSIDGVQLSLPADQWRDRFATAFADGYADAAQRGDAPLMTAALAGLCAQQIELTGAAPAFELLAALSRAFAARSQGGAAAPPDAAPREVTVAMFPPEAVRAILAGLAAGADEEQALPIQEAIASGLAIALEAIPDGMLFAEAVRCCAVAQPWPVRQVLLAYVRRWASGHEAGLAELAQSPHLDVRLAALGAHAAGDRVHEEVQKLLDDPRPASRIEALGTIAGLGVTAIGPALVRRIQLPDFHTLSLEERRQWLEAVSQLSPGRAERLAVELLEKRQLLPTEATEETRELAAQVLLRQGRSHDALNAVKEASKPRWWNTPGVREVAARAVALIAARLTSQRAGPATSRSGASTVPPPSGGPRAQERVSSIPPARKP